MYTDPKLLRKELEEQRILTRQLRGIIADLSGHIAKLEGRNSDVSRRHSGPPEPERWSEDDGCIEGECPCHLCVT